MRFGIKWENYPDLMTPNELYDAKILPLGRNGIYDFCNSKDAPVLRFGKKILISRDGLRRMIESA